MPIKLMIGTAQFGLDYGIANSGGKVDFNEAKEILGLAFDNGIQDIDTAIAYGDSESVLGKIGVSNLNVISKLPEIPVAKGFVVNWIKKTVSDSLTRLSVTRLEGLLLHRPAQLLTDIGPEIYQALIELKDAGVVSKIGVSIYQPAELDALTDYKFDVVQGPYNFFDRRIETSGWLAKLHEQNVLFHCRSIFLQGLLLMKPGDRPDKFLRWSSLWQDWDQYLKHANMSNLQACLSFASTNPVIEKIVIGIDSSEQLLEILSTPVKSIPELPSSFTNIDPIMLDPSRWAEL